MVSTRGSSARPSTDSLPPPSPIKTRTASARSRTVPVKDTQDDDSDAEQTESSVTARANSAKVRQSTNRTKASTTTATATAQPFTSTKWSHTPTHLTTIWLSLAIPIVLWDAFYVLLRPHTFVGGKLHWPLYRPYSIYQETDYTYGWPAWEEQDGWPAAQSLVNVFETLGYALYLWVAVSQGVVEDEREEKRWWSWFRERRRVDGRRGAELALGLFTISAVTVAKTVLYMLIEYFSGWKRVGHNTAIDLFFLFVIPNGLWLIFPTVMAYSSGKDILRGLSIAAHEEDVPDEPILL